MTGEDIRGTTMGFELDGGDCGCAPEDNACVVIPDPSTVVEEKSIAEMGKDCEYAHPAGGGGEEGEREYLVI